MNKIITMSFVLMLAVLLIGGGVAVVSLKVATERLDRLVLLHQVELLREDLIIRVEQVQSYISRNKIRNSGDVDALNARIREMDQAIASCLGCHHSPERTQGLLGMRDVANDYKQAISLLTAGSTDPSGRVERDSRAQALGSDLIAMTRGMAFTANTGLHRKNQEVMQSLGGVRTTVLSTIFLALVLAAVTAAVLMKDLNRAVSEMIESMRRVARGDLQRREETGAYQGSREKAWNDAFNSMTKNLALERSRIEQDARVSGALAMAANVGTRLGEPLELMMKTADKLFRSSGMSAEARALLQTMSREIEQCRDAISRLSVFAQDLQLRRRTSDIAALVRDAVTQMQQDARKNSITLVFDCPADLPTASVDSGQIMQVFSCLTRNAMDALSAGGVLTIKCSQGKDLADRDVVVIEYADTRPGIVEKNINDMFIPTLDNSVGEAAAALSLSYWIVRSHGGRIEVDRLPEKGAAVRVVLPV